VGASFGSQVFLNVDPMEYKQWGIPKENCLSHEKDGGLPMTFKDLLQLLTLIKGWGLPEC
jgi:hypothetical protein